MATPTRGAKRPGAACATICVLVACAAAQADARDVLNNLEAADVMEAALFGVIDAISYSDDPDRYAKACSHVDTDTIAVLPEPHSIVFAKIAVACSQLPNAETPDEEAFWRWGILRPTALWICAYADSYTRSRVGAMCNVGQRMAHAKAAAERYNDKGNGPNLDWYAVTVTPSRP